MAAASELFMFWSESQARSASSARQKSKWQIERKFYLQMNEEATVGVEGESRLNRQVRHMVSSSLFHLKIQILQTIGDVRFRDELARMQGTTRSLVQLVHHNV